MGALPQFVWESPARFTAAFLALTWAVLFVGHRLIMFKEAWVRESMTLQDSQFVVHNICRHTWMRANLGEEYSDVCARASYNARLWPSVSAAKYVVQNTHLCGDVGCVDVVRRVADAVGHTVALCACSALLAVYLLSRRSQRTRRWEEESSGPTMPITWKEPTKLD